MPSCLGIYIEDRLIKYAKVSKEKDNIKVESFDIKFYEDLEKTLEQIIQETNSQKIPIAINISEEMYNYFEVFSLLSSSDIKRSMDIEFEVLCTEQGYNKELLVARYLTLSNPDNMDKLKIVNVCINKTELNERVSKFDKSKLVSARPLPTSIMNLVPVNKDLNSIIVNIEDRTYLTIIKNGDFCRVDIIPEGMNDILDKINQKENSYSKSYEICKNTTVSSQGLNIEEGNEYIEDVMPTLYSIANTIKKETEDFEEGISKIYITGSGSSINNVDMYFQEFLDDVPCEILKPEFLEATSLKIGIKEYIEVNSAIALALDGLGSGIKDLNFVNNKMASITSTIQAPTKIQIKGKESFKAKFDPIEKLLFRVIATFMIFIIGYGIISNIVVDRLDEKSQKSDEVKKSVTTATSSANKDKADIASVTKQYEEQIDKLKGKNSNSADGASRGVIMPKDALPIFMHQIMTSIPRNVIIESMENTQGVHMVIETKSKEYQQIGLFKAILYNQKILENVTSNGSVKEGEYVKVTIEGDIPIR